MTERSGFHELIARYLKQQAELGETGYVLERLTVGRALDLLRSLPPRFAPSHAGPIRSQTGPTSSTDVDQPARAGLTQGTPAFEALRTEVLGCTLCRLAEGRTTVVFGEGDPSADLLVVGEAPGLQEDRSGRPFVGPAGQLLDKMLKAIGFERAEVFICNILKCRPPENRDPLPDEVASCRPYLKKQIELIEPKAICAFGRFAAQTLLSTDQSLGRLRGVRHDYLDVPLVVTYHPAALLRNTQWKRPAWDDLKLLRRVYDEAGGRAPGAPRG